MNLPELNNRIQCRNNNPNKKVNNQIKSKKKKLMSNNNLIIKGSRYNSLGNKSKKKF